MSFGTIASSPRWVMRTARHRLLFLAMLACITAPSSALAVFGSSELWTINVDGTGLKKFADTAGYTCGSPEWSPNGEYVAFGAWREIENLRNAHIFVIRADGTGGRDLGPGAMPNWSPDGKLIVFHTYGTGTDSDQVVIMNLDGTGREPIINHWGSPRWPRHGNRIVSILNGNLALFDLDDGTERSILAQSLPIELGFAVSADGTKFCFSTTDGGLFLTALDERQMRGSVRRLLSGGKHLYASFSPDGKNLVCGWKAPTAKVHQLYILNLDGDPNPRRIDGQDKSRLNWAPNWSPDGKTIIFGSKAWINDEKDVH